MWSKKLKYCTVFILPALAFFSIQSSSYWTFSLFLFAFGLIPILELFFQPDSANLTTLQEDMIKEDRFYDWLLYFLVPVQFFLLYLFLDTIQRKEFTILEYIGIISAMGIMCGVLGINLAHELGHRTRNYEKWLSKALLATSLYMHFYIEHNRGHHNRVATSEDPATARLNESIYVFFFRSIWGSYWSAWNLEISRLKKLKKIFFHWQNEMLVFHIIQLSLLLIIFYLFGLKSLLAFILAAGLGILLLETVNYIEHYGLQREKVNGKYERTMPKHSWNSDHPIGRMILFELSRHSDHHYLSTRKYQILRHHNTSPQMPTGYPGMMVLSLLTPLWFVVMHNWIKKQNN